MAVCDIVVPTWNRKDLIAGFLQSFLANTSTPCRIIIVDNASTDGTKEYLSTLEDTSKCRFEIIINGENRGYVGGMNQGIAVSSAPYVCLANNDLIFTPEWLKEIISVFKKYPRAGVLNPNSNSLGAYIPEGISRESFSGRLREKNQGVFVEVPFCIGFCMVIRREVIAKVGGLSQEFYPMFFEDTDYSLKVKKAGYTIGIARGAYVWHAESASFKKLGQAEKEKKFARSRKVFLKKWGRILRVAWVVNSYDELLANLKEAIELARAGNFVWFLVKKFNPERKRIFSDCRAVEHSGINFIRFNNALDLFWKVFKKKKKYDVIIDSNAFHGRVFANYGVLAACNREEIDKLKHS